MTVPAVAKLCFALLLCAGACTLSNLSPTQRFSEAAFVVNDASRWGQIDVAAQYVGPAYRALFADRRREWGERIQIAEVEVVHMHIDKDNDSASSVVNISWTSDGITLRKSVIAQTWSSRHSAFRLVEEKIKSGDTALFAAPEAPTQ